jgi:hypothetical protein
MYKEKWRFIKNGWLGTFSGVALSCSSTSSKNIKKTIQLPVELIERNTTRKD